MTIYMCSLYFDCRLKHLHIPEGRFLENYNGIHVRYLKATTCMTQNIGILYIDRDGHINLSHLPILQHYHRSNIIRMYENY